VPGLRSRPQDDNPFNRACTAILRLANRVYEHDLTKLDGCVHLVTDMRRTVNNAEYDEANYNPFQEFANRLKASYPEVWRGDGQYSAQQALAPWGVS
jgi:hypothetical protein